MKKIVPDPPLHSLVTKETSIGHCPEHADLFRVQPGVGIEDALVHVSLLLRCAVAASAQAVEHSHGVAQDFGQCTQQLLEMARGLTESLVKGLEAKPAQS
ncbi:hypothetical protein DCO48_19995 [Pseudomonas sp. SDI]|uniref:DUF3077 domain-containing protein n=1 Tax=Pseudomonas sp. SDI TaxID=2170734 RepID=UPI000DE680F3|nr:DUF3077 domain-containing protein [Pseudomonas sp. SDI]PWB30624.1 hypothetical protein DCO48_19995 [Pseudomonas sp. SDI]